MKATMHLAGLSRVVLLLGFAAAVYLLAEPPMRAQSGQQPPGKSPQQTAQTTADPAKLPRMVDVGKKWCIPCKKMVAVLQEAELRYKGKAVIEFVDLDEHPEAAQQYKIMMIPTQVFYDANGKEADRHVGYMPFEDVERQFTKMGVSRSS